MNIETKSGNGAGPNFTDPTVVDEHIASIVNTLIQVTDPRVIIQALLGNAAGLSQLVLAAGKGNHAQVANVFSRAMVDALAPRQEVKEEPRIEVVPGGVIDLSKRR